MVQIFMETCPHEVGLFSIIRIWALSNQHAHEQPLTILEHHRPSHRETSPETGTMSSTLTSGPRRCQLCHLLSVNMNPALRYYCHELHHLQYPGYLPGS